MPEALLYVFVIVVVVQLGFLYFLRIDPPRLSVPPLPDDALPEISILICAKNEAENLTRFLPFVLDQDYPAGRWEVVVVNDASTDRSLAILNDFSSQHPHLRITSISRDAIRDLPGKKFALNHGMAVCRHPLVLLTDADCQPASRLWLRTLAQTAMHSNKPIVLGYGGHFRQDRFLNRFINWETAHTAWLYFSFALRKKAYMGVGRNLMYARHLYFEAGNDARFWEYYAHTPSGDDDLLVSKMAETHAVAICPDPMAHTFSPASPTWRQWKRQKARHLSTGKYYPKSTQTLLGLYGLSHGLYWLLVLIGCMYGLISTGISTSLALIFAAAAATRLLLYWQHAVGWYRQLRLSGLLLFYPIGDFCWAIYNLIFASYIFWKNNNEWK